MIVQALLKKGVPVDEIDDNGMTPLHVAVSSNHGSIVQLLLEAGADPTLPMPIGK